MPCASAAARMRSSSVAMTTRSAPLARARSATRTTIGLPRISSSGLPGRRVEAKRAGISTVKLTEDFLLVFRRLEPARLLLQHHRNPVANRVGQPRRPGDELLPLPIVDERTLGHRADENLKQLGVHGLTFPVARPARGRCAPGSAGTSNAGRRTRRILPHPSRSSG